VLTSHTLLHLLQLASPALPVGAYSYSEGLEALVEKGRIHDSISLEHWLNQELHYGAVRLEAAVMVRGYRAAQAGNSEQLRYWNAWLSAARETEELRLQSWQMGRSLLRLLHSLQSELKAQDEPKPLIGSPLQGEEWNFAIAFGATAAHWQIALDAALLGYLHSWVTNLVGAGIKLIPLGQTTGQQLLLSLHPFIQEAAAVIPTLPDEALATCGWGLALASMTHETQYSRLFRS